MRLRLLMAPALALGGLVSGLISSGCARDSGGTPGPLGFPPRNNVHILSRRIEQTPDRIHWKWSIIGDRNWLHADANGAALTLQDTYPMNDTTRLHGCFAWEADLVAERRADAPRTLHWATTLHGSNGVTARGEGTAPLNDSEPDRAVQIDHDRDSVAGLPANVTLARIGDQMFTITIKP